MKRVLLVIALAALAYARFLRGPILTWGATDEEAAAHLPGDELLEEADGVATRAITIDAPPSAVWPWIAQMGPSPRGGAYTYDRVENLLGLDMHSADQVLDDFQHPQVGEGFGFGANEMRYARVEPEHVLATRSADGNWVWTFVLEGGNGRTRLISRNRFRLPRLRDRVAMIPMEPGSLVMERKMLEGIKQRAERLHRHRAAAPAR
ncbi:MAG TPA: SRPBCC family protein [Gaiellaceae bacterium]|nr:SRPBCC family protein [Gaiellaceae bacterium]